MKTTIFLVSLAFCMKPLLALTAQTPLTLQWHKPVVEPDLAAFHLQYSTDAYWENYLEDQNPTSGTWTDLISVPFKIQQSVYQLQTPIIVPAQTENDYYFRIRALDTSGNASDWNYGTEERPCMTWIDFKAPSMTIQLTIIIETDE